MSLNKMQFKTERGSLASILINNFNIQQNKQHRYFDVKNVLITCVEIICDTMILYMLHNEIILSAAIKGVKKGAHYNVNPLQQQSTSLLPARYNCVLAIKNKHRK
jgi:hypothetical protein